MNLVENVYKVAQEFMKNPLEVELNYEQIEKTANEMLSYGKLEITVIGMVKIQLDQMVLVPRFYMNV